MFESLFGLFFGCLPIIIVFVWLIKLQINIHSLNSKISELEEFIAHNNISINKQIQAIKQSEKTQIVKENKIGKNDEIKQSFNDNIKTQNVEEEKLDVLSNEHSISKKSSVSNTSLASEKSELSEKKSVSITPVIDKLSEQLVKKESLDDLSQKEIASTPNEKPKEQITFVQIFSWIGGFILILGIIFGIKYSLENNLISPLMRIVIGILVGIGMWVGGALLREPKVKTTSDTLCACGLCTCYSVIFAAYYFYLMFSAPVTFILLSLVALASFATAVWKKAQYIGVLAQIIGFLTPSLFYIDNPQIWSLLAYTGLINVAAVFSALKCNWTSQLYSGLGFTCLNFLTIVKKGNSLELSIFAVIFIFLYTLIANYYKKEGLLRFSFAFSLLGLIVLGFRDYSIDSSLLTILIIYGGIFSIFFGLLACWKNKTWLFIASLGFAFFTFVFIALTKAFFPLYIFIGFLIIFFGYLSAKMRNPLLQGITTVLALLGFIILYFGSITYTDVYYLPFFTGFIVFFAFFFGIISYWQKNNTLFTYTLVLASICYLFIVPFNNNVYSISIASVLTLFFGILGYKLQNNSLIKSSIIFTSLCSIFTSFCVFNNNNIIHPWLTYSIFTSIFYIYFAIKRKEDSIYTIASYSMLFPLFFFTGFTAFKERTSEIIGWVFCWNILVTLIPFFFIKVFQDSEKLWITLSRGSILSVLLLWFISYFSEEHINIIIGTVALIISVIYAYLIKEATLWNKLDEGNQSFILSCFVYAPILFLTLGIILHSSNEWKTMGLAIEGLFLIFIWHQLKVNTIQNFGLGLMSVVMCRLLFNYKIESYYPQTNLIFNWYLYTYLLCALLMFCSSYLWRKTDNTVVPSIFNSFGGILLFALVNIEIANYFAEGKGLSFNFCGQFREAAAYTIAWTIFGALCMSCFSNKSLWCLKVGIGLISLALVKLFISDIWRLSSGLRIAVLISVAVVLLSVSFMYQQLKKNNYNKDEEKS